MHDCYHSMGCVTVTNLFESKNMPMQHKTGQSSFRRSSGSMFIHYILIYMCKYQLNHRQFQKALVWLVQKYAFR